MAERRGGGLLIITHTVAHWPLKKSYRRNAGTERNARVSLAQVALYNKGWEGGGGEAGFAPTGSNAGGRGTCLDFGWSWPQGG